MNYALDQFTMQHQQVFMVQGANSLFTYQNIGTTPAVLQGSNDAIQWSDIVEVQVNSAIVQEHSYKYLRSLGNTQILANRGEGNNHNDSSPVISVNQKIGAVLLTANDVQADSKGSSDSVKMELQTYIDALTTHKLDASEYIQHFKGVFSSKAALDHALPTAQAGDTADIDSGSGFDVMRAIWDESDQKWIIREVNNAQNTDQVPEGNSNKYFTSDRVRDILLNGLNLSTNSPIQSTDSLLIALGKIQAQLDKLNGVWVEATSIGFADINGRVDINGWQFARINGMLWCRGLLYSNLIDVGVVAKPILMTITDINYKVKKQFLVEGKQAVSQVNLFSPNWNNACYLYLTSSAYNTATAQNSTQTFEVTTKLNQISHGYQIQPTCLGELVIK